MTEHPEPPSTPPADTPTTPDTPKAQTTASPFIATEPFEPTAQAGPQTPVPGTIITSDDQRWNLIAHYGAAVLLVLTVGTCGWLAGLLTLFLKGGSPVVRAHAVESVNFQLTWGLFTILGITLGLVTSWTCLGLLSGLSALLAGGFAFVFAIVAGRYAARGILYRYPVSFRIIQ
jgi:uncharacterized Tic20 family protein